MNEKDGDFIAGVIAFAIMVCGIGAVGGFWYMVVHFIMKFW